VQPKILQKEGLKNKYLDLDFIYILISFRYPVEKKDHKYKVCSPF